MDYPESFKYSHEQFFKLSNFQVNYSWKFKHDIFLIFLLQKARLDNIKRTLIWW